MSGPGPLPPLALRWRQWPGWTLGFAWAIALAGIGIYAARAGRVYADLGVALPALTQGVLSVPPVLWHVLAVVALCAFGLLVPRVPPIGRWILLWFGLIGVLLSTGCGLTALILPLQQLQRSM